MKATKITYSRLFNMGDYNNEKIEVEVQLEEGESAAEGLKRAKAFVDKNGPRSNSIKNDYERAKYRLENEKDMLTLGTIKKLEEIIKEYESTPENQFDL